MEKTYLIRGESVVLQSKLFKVIFLMCLLFPLVGIGALILYFSNMSFLLPLLIVIYLSLGAILIVRTYKLTTKKKILYRVMIIAIVLSMIPAIPGIYHQTRPVVQETHVNLYEYSPYSEDSKAVQLEEPSTFQIQDSLPVMDGATALYPIYAAFAQAVYPEKTYEPYNSEVMSNRTGEAYDNLIAGHADIIFALAPSDEQQANAKRAGKELTLTPIGKEAFVFFVNSKNEVNNLSVEDIKGIYSGDITNWKEVGGKHNDIRAFQRDKNSGSQTALERFMGDRPIMDPPVEDIASLMGTMVDVVSSYKNYSNAIGYTFRYYSTKMVHNNNIRLLNVNGVEPTVDSIRSGDYPITNDIYAITAGSDNPHIEPFIDWILSEQGQRIIEETGYVPIKQ